MRFKFQVCGCGSLEVLRQDAKLWVANISISRTHSRMACFEMRELD